MAAGQEQIPPNHLLEDIPEYPTSPPKLRAGSRVFKHTSKSYLAKKVSLIDEFDSKPTALLDGKKAKENPSS